MKGRGGGEQDKVRKKKMEEAEIKSLGGSDLIEYNLATQLRNTCHGTKAQDN
jgi:hypothetical protein